MINFFKTLESTIDNKKENIMGRKKLANSTKFLNALLRGDTVTWSDAKANFALARPRAVVEKLREEGHCVYANKSVKNGTSYRIGKPSKEIIAAGLAALDGVYA
jgi:hypothetical protein|tara:strand:- start:871 stop:1182 length:312 start_codon:yes stop_codon:yes gene_type:complete